MYLPELPFQTEDLCKMIYYGLQINLLAFVPVLTHFAHVFRGVELGGGGTLGTCPYQQPLPNCP